jgi:hypothetical protein
VNVHAARLDPLTPRSQAIDRAAQQRERDWEALAKERRIRRRECLNQYNEEYQLCEQQGLSPPPVLANSSSDEEESDGERATSDRWEPAAPPSPRAEGAATKSTLEAARRARSRPSPGHRWRYQRATRRRP